MVITFVISAILLLLGIVFITGKGDSLLIRSRNMSKEEVEIRKKEIRTKNISKVMGIAFIIVAIIEFIIGLINTIFFTNLGSILVILLVIFYYIYTIYGLNKY